MTNMIRFNSLHAMHQNAEFRKEFMILDRTHLLSYLNFYDTWIQKLNQESHSEFEEWIMNDAKLPNLLDTSIQTFIDNFSCESNETDSVLQYFKDKQKAGYTTLEEITNDSKQAQLYAKMGELMQEYK